MNPTHAGGIRDRRRRSSSQLLKQLDRLYSIYTLKAEEYVSPSARRGIVLEFDRLRKGLRTLL